MQIDYLKSNDGRVHAINCSVDAMSMEAGILCLISFPDDAVTISNDNHRFVVEVPKEFRSNSERVKVFNASLAVLSHEQV